MPKPYKDSKKKVINLEEPFSFSQEMVRLQAENKVIKELLQEKLNLKTGELQQLIEQKKGITLPLSIFKNELSTLEVIVKYCKENLHFHFSEIASFLNRNQRTIWHAYRRATKKKISIAVEISSITVPLAVFSKREYAPLEVLVSHLKDSHYFSFTKIASLLQLSPKTVWTEYHRYQKKQHGR